MKRKNLIKEYSNNLIELMMKMQALKKEVNNLIVIKNEKEIQNKK